MTYDFSDKNAVVTGASRGIGAVIARTLAQCGARVALVARNTGDLEEVARDLPNDPVILHADLGSPEGWKPLAEAILEQLGPVDILVNNAGVSVHEPAGKVTEEGLDSTLTINVRNLVLLTDALSESLRSRRGNIVNISSVSASLGTIGQLACSASKGAVNSLTRNLSIDLGRSGVRVNAVAPGVIDDGMWKTSFESGLDREKMMERIGKIVPLERRWGSAQNVADAVAFLASGKADYITGQVLRVDGGMLA